MLVWIGFVRCIFESKERVSCFKVRSQDLFPEAFCRDHFSGNIVIRVFQFDISFLELLSVKFCQLCYFERVEKSPGRILFHPLHKEVIEPERREEVVCPAAFFTGILLKVKEIPDIHMPWLDIDSDSPLAGTELINCNGNVIGDLQERDDPSCCMFVPVNIGTHPSYQ